MRLLITTLQRFLGVYAEYAARLRSDVWRGRLFATSLHFLDEGATGRVNACPCKVFTVGPSVVDEVCIATASQFRASNYFSFAFSLFAAMRMGMSASASFQRVRNS